LSAQRLASPDAFSAFQLTLCRWAHARITYYEMALGQ
jgi:hypothetical protein